MPQAQAGLQVSQLAILRISGAAWARIALADRFSRDRSWSSRVLPAQALVSLLRVASSLPASPLPPLAKPRVPAPLEYRISRSRSSAHPATSRHRFPARTATADPYPVQPGKQIGLRAATYC